MATIPLKPRLDQFSRQSWLALGTLIALLALLAFLLWSTITTIWFPNTDTSAPTVVALPVTGPAATSIAQMHIFGTSPEDLTNLPLASLGLEVQGIFFNNQADQSRVLIGNAGQMSAFYQVGDSLPGNVKIYKITANSVIVMYQGQLQKLPLALPGLDFNAMQQQGSLFGS
ncbi:MAG: hypothetical protein K5Q00_01420 [Gammaproteobacteria bacterium]|nr:hypothetical protein [Gammaproteobacteria bacterium]